MTITGLSAITLATHNMSGAVRFYRALGFEVIYGAEDAPFTSLRAGAGNLNLISQPKDKVDLVGQSHILCQRRRCYL